MVCLDWVLMQCRGMLFTPVMHVNSIVCFDMYISSKTIDRSVSSPVYIGCIEIAYCTVVSENWVGPNYFHGTYFIEYSFHACV